MSIDVTIVPKYWMAHSTKTGNVFLGTGAISHTNALENTRLTFGDDFEQARPDIEIALFSLNRFELETK